MRDKKFDAVAMKHRLQKEAEQKLSRLSMKEQLELLHREYGYLMDSKQNHLASNIVIRDKGR